MRKLVRVAAAVGTAVAIAATGASCSSDADVVSHNLSKEAENFGVVRRIVFYNGITDKYILQVEGRCSVETEQIGITVTCKVGDAGQEQYRKHFLGHSDNVTWFAEHLGATGVGSDHYVVNWKPKALVPYVEAR